MATGLVLLLTFSLVIAVYCLFVARGKSGAASLDPRNRSPFGLIADPEKLERAEREAKNYRPGDLVIVATFRSDQGHNEASLASLIIYLGSEGVDATYDTTPVGFAGGALLQFSLKVPPLQLDKARTLLRGKLASG